MVEDLEEGRFHSLNQAKEHYGIRGDGTVQRWLNRCGRNRICPKVIRVEKSNEQDQVRQLKKQIRQLEQALGRTQADKVLNEAFLKLAFKELGQDVETFKKKSISRCP